MLILIISLLQEAIVRILKKSEHLPQTTKDFDFPIEKGRYRSTSPPLKNSETTVTGENREGEFEARNKEREEDSGERKRNKMR